MVCLNRLKTRYGGEGGKMIAILYFLAVIGAMGFAAWRLLGLEEEDGGTRLVMQFAAGIVAFVMASVVLGAIGQANSAAYLVLAAALAAAAWQKKPADFRLPEAGMEWKLVAAMFAAHLAVYAAGAFQYPYLEDDDPWEHAAAAHYVSVSGSYLQPEHLPLHYLAPYTPFYDVLMGVLFQVDNSSMQATLKFFNALLASLSIPFFFCWARERLGGRTALWASFALAVLPCFMSHFIWSQTLALALVFPALYFMEKFSKAGEGAARKAFGIMAVLSSAAVFMTQPSTGAMFGGLMAAYLAALALPDAIAARTLSLAKLKPPATALFGGLLVAVALFWGPMFVVYPVDKVFAQNSLSAKLLTDVQGDTGGGLVYGLGDFIDAPLASKMDQPTGFGPAMAILLAIGAAAAALALRSPENRDNAAVMLLWLAYGLIGTEGNLLPVKLVPHRFWVFLAIPVAILAGYGAVRALEYVEKNRRALETVAKVLIVALLLYTSAYPKAVVETSAWPPGAKWVSEQHIAGYVGLKALPPNTPVFNFCMGEQFADGMDKAGYAWVKEVADYKYAAINDSTDANYAFLKKYGYKYAIIDQSCMKGVDAESIRRKIDGLTSDARFSPVTALSNEGLLTFTVK